MVQFLLKFEPAGIMTLRFLDLERKILPLEGKKKQVKL